MTVWCVCLCVCVCVCVCVCEVCAGWTYSGLHCYRLFTYEFVYSDRTWMTALNQCRAHGASLVSINSANEAFAVNNMLQVSTDEKPEVCEGWNGIGVSRYFRFRPGGKSVVSE